MGNKLYVGNLAYSVRDESLQEAFGQFGSVTSAKVMMDRETGRSKGFGFVEMGSDAEAQAAINGMNGQALEGRAIVVNEARPREEAAVVATAVVAAAAPAVAAATAAAVVATAVVAAAAPAVAATAAVAAATVVAAAAAVPAVVAATAAVAVPAATDPRPPGQQQRRSRAPFLMPEPI
jgi:RNA recognition motif-containing protein